MRILLGLVLTPLIVSLYWVGISLVFEGSLPRLDELLLTSMPTYMVTLLGLIVFGLPVTYLLKRLRLLNIISLSLSGAITGVFYYSVINVSFAIMFGSNFSIDRQIIVLGCIFGLVTALVFGLVSGICKTPT